MAAINSTLQPLIDIGEVVTHAYFNKYKEEAFPAYTVGYKLVPSDLPITENPPRYIGDTSGDDSTQKYLVVPIPINPLGGIDVFVQDQRTEIIDLLLTRLIQDITIITNTSIGDTVITISSLIEPVNGNSICLKEQTAFYQGTILSHIANGANWDITLDTPLDYAFTVVGGCSERSDNLGGQVGTLATPIIYSVSPDSLNPGTKWDITRILISIISPTAMDDDKFGGITKLINGIVLRSVDGITKNIFNIKSNGDFALRAYDIEYAPKAPAGSYGLRVRRSFNGQDKNGVVIRLGADTNDELQLLIQDSLVGITSFKIVAQGHVVD